MEFGLYASLYSTEMKGVYCFMNIYGPYLDRVRFWNNLLSLDCLKSARMIFGEILISLWVVWKFGVLRLGWITD